MNGCLGLDCSIPDLEIILRKYMLNCLGIKCQEVSSSPTHNFQEVKSEINSIHMERSAYSMRLATVEASCREPK